MPISPNVCKVWNVAPSVAANSDVGNVFHWTNINGAKVFDDASSASCSTPAFTDGDYLELSDFDFSMLPSDAEAVGINPRCWFAGVVNYASPDRLIINVHLMKNGTNTATFFTTRNANNAWVNFGGASELFDETFDYGDLTDPDFGVAILNDGQTLGGTVDCEAVQVSLWVSTYHGITGLPTIADVDDTIGDNPTEWDISVWDFQISQAATIRLNVDCESSYLIARGFNLSQLPNGATNIRCLFKFSMQQNVWAATTGTELHTNSVGFAHNDTGASVGVEVLGDVDGDWGASILIQERIYGPWDDGDWAGLTPAAVKHQNFGFAISFKTINNFDLGAAIANGDAFDLLIWEVELTIFWDGPGLTNGGGGNRLVCKASRIESRIGSKFLGN